MNACKITRGFPAIIIALIAILVFAAPVFAQGEQPPAPPPPPDAGPAAPAAPLPAGDEDHPAPASLVAQAGPPSPWILIGGTVRTFTTIQGALDAISSEGLTPTDRAVHIDAGAFTETLVSLNGANTFLGQLQKMEGNCDNATRACNPSDPNQTVLNGSLAINNTRLGFTLQGMTVNGYVVFDNNTGALQLKSLIVQNTAGNGITVTNQKGAITLDTVASNGNAGYGAYLNNAGVIAPVTVRSSAFDGNGLDTQRTVASLTIVTRGAILIDGVSANNNNSDGATVQTPAALTVRNSRFEFNHKVENSGVPIAYGHGFGVSSTETPANILMDTVFANNNEDTGIYLRSKGAITLTNLTVNNNLYNGLIVCTNYLCNEGLPATATLLIQNSAFNHNSGGAIVNVKGSVTLLSSFFFNNLSSNGLDIHAGGAVLLNQVIASSNAGRGVKVDISGPGVRGSLTVLDTLGANEFSNNSGGSGLDATVQGSINLSGVNAHDNLVNGLRLNTSQPYLGQGITLFNVRANGNGQTGMVLDAAGTVSLKTSGASNNGSDSGSTDGGGVRINNIGGGVFPVILTDVWFNDNQDGSGLVVLSKGLIMLTNLRSASGNAGYGLILDNTAGMAPVSVNRTTPYDHNFLGYNARSGLLIFSKSAVSLNRVMAINNGDFGAYIDNCIYDDALGRCAGAGPVTITTGPDHWNVFQSNGWSGLYVKSAGMISTYRIDASGNGEHGALLINYSATAPLPVIVTLGRFDHNANGDGLHVASNGQITITDVDARDNDVHDGFLFLGGIEGVSVNERLIQSRALTGDVFKIHCSFNKSVQIELLPTFAARLELYRWDDVNKVYTFVTSWDGDASTPIYQNQSLTADTYQVRIVGLSAGDFGNYTLSLDDPTHNDRWGNGGSGVYVYNQYTGAAGGVTVKRTLATQYNELTNNSDMGLVIFTKGAISISNVVANGNGGCGALFKNNLAAIPQPVTINGGAKWNEFNANGQGGLVVLSKGAISLTNTDAIGNTANGMTLDNAAGAAGVTYRTNSNTLFNGLGNNGGSGLIITSRGAILIDRVHACNNNFTGADLNNSGSSFPASITVMNSEFSDNFGGNGLRVTSRGAITLNAVNAGSNSGDGANLDNTTGPLAQPVTLINSTFNSNGGYGVGVNSLGNIFANNLTSNFNRHCGAILKNDYTNATGTVTVTGVGIKTAFSFNRNIGLYILSNKNINVNTTIAESNGQHGFFLSTSGPITVINSQARLNGMNGIEAISQSGDITLINFKSLDNSQKPTIPVLKYANGAVLRAMNGNIRIINSAFVGHRAAGVSYFVPAGKSLFLANTVFSANNLEHLLPGMGNLYKM